MSSFLIKTLFFALKSFALLCMTSSVSLAMSCKKVHHYHANQLQKAEFDQKFYSQLVGEKPHEDLDFFWKFPYPFFVKFNPETSTHTTERSLKFNRDFRGIQNNPAQPLVAIGRMSVGSHLPMAETYNEAYKNYEGRIKQELIETLHQIDTELDYVRTGFGKIENVVVPWGYESTGEPIKSFATIRFYEGTKYSSPEFTPSAELNRGMALPFERLNERRGLQLDRTKELLQSLRDSGARFFEVGKYSIKSESPLYRERMSNLFDLFWFQKYATVMPDSFFFAHVTSAAAARHYQQKYGFKILEKYEVPGNPDGEYILYAKGETIAQKISDRLAISRPVYIFNTDNSSDN
jgi:hypothetical protein